jgi:hypothetical protein
VAVARQGQLALEFGFVQLLLDLELEGVTRQKAGRCEAVQGRGSGHDDHIGPGFLVALLDAPQRSQALADQVLVRRESVVGQRLPVGKQGAAQVGGEECNFFKQALGVIGIGSDHHHRQASGFFAFAQLGQQQCIGRSRRAGQGIAFAAL